MTTLILKQPGRLDQMLSEIASVQVDVDALKFDLLFFNRFYNIAKPLAPAPFSFGGPEYLVDGDELYRLSGKELIHVRKAGYDCTLREMLRDLQAHAEERFMEDCLFADSQNHVEGTKYPVLSARFLKGFPAPQRKHSIDDILDFKERRKDELGAFWREVFSFANGIDGATRNPDLQLLDRLHGALSDLEKVSEENWMTRVRRSIELKLTLKGSSTIPFGVAGGLASAGVETLLASFAALPGLFNASIDLAPSRSPISQTAAALSYVSRVKNEM